MKVFIPAPAAQAMSDALWSLSRPADIRGPHDTQYLFPWREALDLTLWLAVETDYEINVHPDADAAAIVAVLQPYEAEGALPAGTLAALAARVEALRGGRLVVYGEFPDLFKLPTAEHPEGLARTLAEMIEAGKFMQPEGGM
jgi:hypothetical protein